MDSTRATVIAYSGSHHEYVLTLLLLRKKMVTFVLSYTGTMVPIRSQT